MGSWPGDVMWAYVLSAVLSVCGVSLGLSGRTALVMTRNLKVQMNPPALWGYWYTVAHRRKINEWPLFIFGLRFGVLVQKGCTCCLSVLHGRSELLGHRTAACPLQNWLLFLFFFLKWNFRCCCCCVCYNFLSDLLRFNVLNCIFFCRLAPEKLLST